MIVFSICGIIFLLILYTFIGIYCLEVESDWWPCVNYESIYWKLIRRKLQSLSKNKPNEYKYDIKNDLYWYQPFGSKNGVLAIFESPDIDIYENGLTKIIVIFWPIVCLMELINYIKYKIKGVN